jgi:VanZ family protein
VVVLAAISWMVAIFVVAQLPYFTGKNTSEVIQKVVVVEQQAVSTPSADPIDINELNLLVREATHIIVFGILACLLYKSLESFRFPYVKLGF